jgi:hypothetical protein
MKNVVVFDVDGTVAEMGKRKELLLQKPIDWEKFYNDSFQDDKPIENIINLVKDMRLCGREVVFCTARKEKSRLRTGQWILKNIGLFEKEVLLMRDNDDNRTDDIVKPEMLSKAGYTTDNVLFIVEDRARIVKKWRELGFTCLQCAEGDF